VTTSSLAPQVQARARRGIELVDEASAERLLDFATNIAAEIRLSGSAAEARAFDYIFAQLQSMGLDPRRYSCETLISLPGRAALTVVSPDQRELSCITHSMARSTPPGGLELEVVYVGAGKSKDYAGQDFDGKTALVEGLATPGKVRTAQANGCFTQIYINDEHFHEMILSDPYGSPTPDTVGDLPRSVAVSVTRDSGDLLKDLLQRGPVRVRVTTEVDTGWREIPLIAVDIRGQQTDHTFALFGTHVDSWHYGATDNAAGNAVALEMARILAAHRDELERGIRFLFWSGHSHGRYAGSCWYVDHFWQDLYDHAVVGMSIDSPGGLGATSLGGAKVMDEALGIMQRSVDAVFPNIKATARRPEGGEQPFWRVGVPSLNPLRSKQEKGSPTSMPMEPASGWWHHAPEDTVDKIDPRILRRDLQVHLLSLWQIMTEPVLPFEYRRAARAVVEYLSSLPPAPGVDLSDLVELGQRLEGAAERLQAEAEHADDPARCRELSEAVRQMGRTLIPVLYTLEGPWDPDSTANKGFLPGLADVARLSEIDARSDEAFLLRTRLVRERNRIVFGLRSAIGLAEGCTRG
jgi:hypothetical protein